MSIFNENNSDSKQILRRLNEKFNNPFPISEKVLELTNKQEHLMKTIVDLILDEESPIKTEDDVEKIEQLIRQQLIENWESQDSEAAEHLRDIRDQLIRDDGYTIKRLELYQRILTSKASENEFSQAEHIQFPEDFIVSDDEEGILKVNNWIYKEVFNLKWLGVEIKKEQKRLEAQVRIKADPSWRKFSYIVKFIGFAAIAMFVFVKLFPDLFNPSESLISSDEEKRICADTSQKIKKTIVDLRDARNTNQKPSHVIETIDNKVKEIYGDLEEVNCAKFDESLENQLNDLYYEIADYYTQVVKIYTFASEYYCKITKKYGGAADIQDILIKWSKTDDQLTKEDKKEFEKQAWPPKIRKDVRNKINQLKNDKLCNLLQDVSP